MRQILKIAIALIFPASAAFSQTSDEAAVWNVITQLFSGMEKSDSAMVSAAFAREVTMATVFRNKNDERVLHRETSIDGFLKAIASPKKEIWHEEIWNLRINIDGDLASAWCDYAFYAGKTFSHCGADAFLLHRTPAGWKIFHIADTRRKDGCVIPEEIQKKYK